MIRGKWGFAFLAPFVLLTLTLFSHAQEPVSLQVGGRKVQIRGPYAHENLSVFLLHGKDIDNNEYLTLDKGLQTKTVQVVESKREQVRELTIENRSKQPLFVQEGDRLSGGKQDRIVVTSLVIPANSGKVPLPTYCIEQSRWREGKFGRAFENCENPVLAAQSVRLAAKVIPNRGGQAAVWYNIRNLKQMARTQLRAPNANSSLNETLDSKQVIALCLNCSKNLGGLPSKQKNVVGAAVAINGIVEEVNLYPNQKLLEQIYPRLVQSYALQAALCNEQSKKSRQATASDVKAFMLAANVKNKRMEQVDANNYLAIQELKDRFQCITQFKGKPVHLQWLNGSKLKEIPEELNRKSRYSPGGRGGQGWPFDKPKKPSRPGRGGR